VALAPDAAEACAGLGVAMVGVDYLSVDCFGAAREHPSHTILMSRKILLLEGLDLTAAAPGRYTLICLPLKMPGAEGSPVRAVLLPEVRTL
jgi:arylformamidase